MSHNPHSTSSAEVDGTHFDEYDDDPITSSVQQESLASSQKIQCPICGTELYAKKALARHFDDVHAEPEKCTLCDLTFIGKRKYKAHLKREHNIELRS
ncbi:hypothetical protein BGW80DRAFT_1463215 [Lactifluus volemus]|nr:hypothetical protein BGW80DRAFT_1463215 [Lactifluus volemus]